MALSARRASGCETDATGRRCGFSAVDENHFHVLCLHAQPEPMPDFRLDILLQCFFADHDNGGYFLNAQAVFLARNIGVGKEQFGDVRVLDINFAGDAGVAFFFFRLGTKCGGLCFFLKCLEDLFFFLCFLLVVRQYVFGQRCLDGVQVFLMETGLLENEACPGKTVSGQAFFDSG